MKSFDCSVGVQEWCDYGSSWIRGKTDVFPTQWRDWMAAQPGLSKCAMFSSTVSSGAILSKRWMAVMARYKDCLLNERKWILSKTRVQSFVNKGTITSLVIRVQWSQSFVMSLHFQYKDGCGPRNQGILPVAIWSVAYSLPRRCSLIAWRTQKVSASEAIRSAVSILIRLFRKMFSGMSMKRRFCVY